MERRARELGKELSISGRKKRILGMLFGNYEGRWDNNGVEEYMKAIWL